ncbi:MAG: Zn-ribbon domain-containing OB-fold protein [Dehalococcoidia bacterium]
MTPYLPSGLPIPAPARDGLDQPFWSGLQEDRLLLQFCDHCQHWQWGPEWICYRCHSSALSFRPVEPSGFIYSYERIWHPVHRALGDFGPYIVVLVELPQADGVRLVGNLLGDPRQRVEIGEPVRGVFEHHHGEESRYTLLQWARAAEPVAGP